MKNERIIRERYMQDDLSIRLGGLAANLARVESFSSHPDHRQLVERLLEESKFFIEWTASAADIAVQAELVDLQLVLAQWQQRWADIWSDTAERSAVALKAGSWSKRVLALSGFGGDPIESHPVDPRG
jgi:hypothetical protein